MGTPFGAGPSPSDVTISGDGKTLYVISDDSSVSPISTGTHRIGASIRLPGNDPVATALAGSPDGKAVYVAFGVDCAGDHSAVVVDRISTSTGKLTSVALAAQT